MSSADKLSLLNAIVVLPVVTIVLVFQSFQFLLLYFALVAIVTILSTRIWENLGVANAVTLLRLIMMLILLYIRKDLAPVIVGSGLLLIHIADLLDGYLARARHETSQLGQILDVETDAAYTLLLTVLYTMIHRLPWWIVTVGLLRYLYVIILDIFDLGKKEHKRQELSRYVSATFSVLLAIYWFLDWQIITIGLQILGLGIWFTFLRDAAYRMDWFK